MVAIASGRGGRLESLCFALCKVPQISWGPNTVVCCAQRIMDLT